MGGGGGMRDGLDEEDGWEDGDGWYGDGDGDGCRMGVGCDVMGWINEYLNSGLGRAERFKKMAATEKVKRRKNIMVRNEEHEIQQELLNYTRIVKNDKQKISSK